MEPGTPDQPAFGPEHGEGHMQRGLLVGAFFAACAVVAWVLVLVLASLWDGLV